MGDAGQPARSLWPRDHLSYGQLLAPLAAALASGTPGASAWAFAVAAICALLVPEPLLVAIGARGRPAQDSDGARATARLRLVTAAAVLAGGLGAALGPPEARLACAGPALAVGALAVIVRLRREKTLVGEVVAASALSGAALPVAVASGIAPIQAIAAWAGWCVGFAAATVAIHGILDHHRGHFGRRGAAGDRAASHAGAVIAALAALAAAAVAFSRRDELAAAAPLLLGAALLLALRPHPARLRRVAWGLDAAAAIAAAGLVWLVRSGF
jgi:hypothetical protein